MCGFGNLEAVTEHFFFLLERLRTASINITQLVSQFERVQVFSPHRVGARAVDVFYFKLQRVVGAVGFIAALCQLVFVLVEGLAVRCQIPLKGSVTALRMDASAGVKGLAAEQHRLVEKLPSCAERKICFLCSFMKKMVK